jgi:hypothetical protein
VPGAKLSEAKMDGKAIPASEITTSASGEQAIVAAGELSHKTRFEFTVNAGGGATR